MGSKPVRTVKVRVTAKCFYEDRIRTEGTILDYVVVKGQRLPTWAESVDVPGKPFKAKGDSTPTSMHELAQKNPAEVAKPSSAEVVKDGKSG